MPNMRLEPPKFWYADRIPFTAWTLLPASKIYGGIVERRFRRTAPYRSSLPVLCVGNFTVGGAGKTPVALKLASLLKARGRNPAFLTRGYGGAERGPHRVDAGMDSAERVGDEPLLLARCAPTVVSRDRPAGARFIERSGADAIVMDDGFQNPSIEKTFSIPVVDAETGVGSGRVFPLGPLRASLDFQVSKASAILLIGARDDAPLPKLLSQALRNRAAQLPIYRASIEPCRPSTDLSGSYLAFCGIGRPAKFYDTLTRAGFPVVSRRSFPDHHPYSERDASRLLDEARELGATPITTEKDRERLKGKSGATGELYRIAETLPIEVRFAEGDEARLLRQLDSAVNREKATA
jgi:tetraacyldisaccharide 4'-kinase